MSELLERIDSLNVYRRGARRAPHKPLLLLIALARLQQGKERLAPCPELCRTLLPLLQTFAPPVKAMHQPELPYWYLRSDGLWEVEGADDLPLQRGGFPLMEPLQATKGGLRPAFVQALREEPVTYRAYVDTGPILERDLAVRGGLGFVGKNTNLIHPQLGSWLFLGELLLAVELPATKPNPDQGTCGGCTRCLDACPTGALVAPYVLDARRCISYLTIELKGVIPRGLRPLLGNRIFGCDICQEVCPWNRRFARPTLEPAFQPRPDALAPHLLDLLSLDASDFRHRYRASPVRRAKRRGLLRNAAVAMGNWGDHSTVAPLTRALGDDEPLVRGHVAWALGRIACSQAQSVLAEALTIETDPWVREEIRLGLHTRCEDEMHA